MAKKPTWPTGKPGKPTGVTGSVSTPTIPQGTLPPTQTTETPTDPPASQDLGSLDFTVPGYSAAFSEWLASVTTTDEYMGAIQNEDTAETYYQQWLGLQRPGPVGPSFGGGSIELPPKPTDTLPPGWTWTWNGKQWVPTQGAAPTDPNAQANIRAEFQSYLQMYGLDSPGLVGLIEKAVTNDWTIDKFLLEMRKHPDYLKNPLFSANLERTKQGKRFMTEGEVLAWRDESRRVAKQYGFDVSDNYLAQGLLSGLSHAEIEHRLQVQNNVNEFGAGVRWVYENELGVSITDQDLFEIFDKERDTTDFDTAYRNALYRGRPMALGLGVRSQAEADAFRMLGVDPEEAFKRYEGVRGNADRFKRLGAIEGLITEGLPADFGANLSTQENSTLVKALLFNDPLALQQLQDVVSREIARFKQQGPTATQGQLVGLLSSEEKASYG